MFLCRFETVAEDYKTFVCTELSVIQGKVLQLWFVVCEQDLRYILLSTKLKARFSSLLGTAVLGTKEKFGL